MYIEYKLAFFSDLIDLQEFICVLNQYELELFVFIEQGQFSIMHSNNLMHLLNKNN